MVAIQLAENGLIPEYFLRLGIRQLIRRRLRDEASRPRPERKAWVDGLAEAPIAAHPEAANAQHYEVPAEFFAQVLGPHLKYSACLWRPGVSSLGEAEAAMLALSAERAKLEDGQRILELGCGWGSMTLWMAEHYPNAEITALSNSARQRAFIEAKAAERGLTNIRIITSDMNDFHPDSEPFDRIVSIEMFEHMRNWSALFERISRWLTPEGRLFLHVFAHQRYAYPFETTGADNWMGREFFTGGMMPSVDMVRELAQPFAVDGQWTLDGTHYQKTAEAWRDNLMAARHDVAALFEQHMTRPEALRQVERWRLFFLACAESFGFRQGQEWVVAHYRLRPNRS